ncbi:MAG TPA: hypothetical protein VFH58_07520 [Acidimicrobiales bacterium]|nr:hypothetical protein [Acidimicrobiales bacterium]
MQVGAGVLWGLVVVGALAASSLLTAVVLIPVAAIATASGVRAAEGRGRSRSRSPSRSRSGGSGSRAGGRSARPSLLLMVSLAASVLVPLIALGGSLLALAGLVVTGGAIATLVLASGFAASARPLRAVASRLVAALAPVLGVTCVVVARHQGSTLALALVGATLAYDAGSFLMGNARTPLGGPVGIAFGVLSVAVVSVFVAAVMNPPFTGSRPWVVFVAVAVLAPLGVRLCQQAVGSERLPALRRLDSLCLVAPMWVLAAALLLHR